MQVKVKNHFTIGEINNISVNLKYDSVGSIFSFNLYFDPDNFQHRELFQPGHYHELDILDGDDLLLRGYMINHVFRDSSKKELKTVSGYSLCGALEDSNIPTSLYPLQFDNESIDDIARKLLSKFSFGYEVDSLVSAKMAQRFKTTKASYSDTIKGYLNNLCSQKDIILSHTPEGNLLFTRAKTKSTPIFHFESQMPGVSMEMSFNGQGLHSHIEVQKQASIDGGNVGKEMLRNPFVPFVFRPTVKVQSSGDDFDTREAVKHALSSELKNIKLVITIDRWRLGDVLVRPNNIITVKNKEIYLYKSSKWFIESVTYNGNESEQTATLVCVLPEVYNGETPDYVFRFRDESHS